MKRKNWLANGLLFARSVGRQLFQRFGKADSHLTVSSQVNASSHVLYIPHPSQILLYCRLYDPSNLALFVRSPRPQWLFCPPFLLLSLFRLPDGTDKFHAVTTTNERQQRRVLPSFFLGGHSFRSFDEQHNTWSVGRGSFSDPSARRSFGD